MIFSRTTGWIGVDIGTHLVKVAQVERRGSKVELIEALCVPRQDPWPDQCADGTDIASSIEIQAALALGRRFRGRDAAVSLPMAVCDIRTCSVEGETDAERRIEVQQQLETIDSSGSPASALDETREFDYWSVELPSEKSAVGDNTIALSVASSWTARVAQDLREVGLTGHVLDGLPLATARAVGISMPNAAHPVAAVDWGHRRATLCLVRNGRPMFVRVLRDCGFQSVTAALCKTLGITTDEARKLLREHGMPSRMHGQSTELQSVIEEVAREPIDRFIAELNRTASYLSQQRRHLAPKQVVLLGGGAAVKNMSGYLNERIETEVESWTLASATNSLLEERRISIEMFGPAIALSSLAWGLR